MYMRITYWDTLYNRDASMIVCGEIKFDQDGAHFASMGHRHLISIKNIIKIEAIEDIEILRFIENGYKVQFIEVDSETVAVDTPNDLEKVRKIVDFCSVL